MITIFGLIVFYVSLQKKFTSEEYHALRGWIFLIFGISAGIPIIHLQISEFVGLEIPFDSSLWVFGGLSYIGGCLLYIMKFPERISPGTFCIVGNSHQIFHLCVIGGVIMHYMASVETYRYRLTHQCPA